MTHDGAGLRDQRVIFDRHPVTAAIHNGGRMAFGPDGCLYVGTGEAGRRAPARTGPTSAARSCGSRPTATPAPGNPFATRRSGRYGHRNVQGLAFDARAGCGPRSSARTPGTSSTASSRARNYGWPVVEGARGRRRFIDPVRPGHRRRLAERHRDRRRRRLRWRRCAASGSGRSADRPTAAGHAEAAAHAALRPAAHRRRRAGRLAVGDDVSNRDGRGAPRRRRPDPGGPALLTRPVLPPGRRPAPVGVPRCMCDPRRGTICTVSEGAA